MVCSHPSRSRGGLLGRRLHLYLAASCTARVTASEPVQPVRGVWSDWSPVRRQAKQGVRAPTPTCAERKRRRGREGAGFDSGRARECKLGRVGGWLGRVGARGKSFTRLDPGSGEGKGGLEARTTRTFGTRFLQQDPLHTGVTETGLLLLCCCRMSNGSKGENYHTATNFFVQVLYTPD